MVLSVAILKHLRVFCSRRKDVLCRDGISEFQLPFLLGAVFTGENLLLTESDISFERKPQFPSDAMRC